jgi:hypothetical protein
MMGLNRFDGTTSKLADDAVGDDRKSSKTNTRQRRSICSSRLSLSRGRKDLVTKLTKKGLRPLFYFVIPTDTINISITWETQNVRQAKKETSCGH